MDFRMMNIYVKYLISIFKSIFLAVIFVPSLCFANSIEFHNQQVLMMVGFDGIAWNPYILELPKKDIKSSDWRKLVAIVDPVSITRQPGTGNFFIKDNAGQLKHYKNTEPHFDLLPSSSLIFPKKLENYTHLRAHNSGLVMVQLLAGKSRDTQLINYNEEVTEEHSKPYTTLVNQAAAQFHPLINRERLFYAHVSCRLACEPIIQEVWQQNLITGNIEQLTMINATSYLHSVDDNNRYGFISSNQDGYYHIVRLNINLKVLTWLTDGQVTDSFPSIASNGDLFFIRRTSQGSYLMKLSQAMSTPNIVSEQISEVVALPRGITKVRYLELSKK